MASMLAKAALSWSHTEGVTEMSRTRLHAPAKIFAGEPAAWETRIHMPPPAWALIDAERALERASAAERAIEAQCVEQREAQQVAERAASVWAAERDATSAKPFKREPRVSKRPLSAAWINWRSGEEELESARRRGCWSDGSPFGKSHLRPYLQPEYALAIADGSKPVEGRPCCGWAAACRPNDAVMFTISASGGQRLACRIMRVRPFPTFAAMLEAVGVDACLPGFTGSVQAAVRLYHGFGSSAGSYADLERTHGVVAVDVQPLTVALVSDDQV